MYRGVSAFAVAVLAFVNIEAVGALTPDRKDGRGDRDAIRSIAPEVLQDAVAASDLKLVQDGSRVMTKGHNRVRLPATSDQPARLESGSKTLVVGLPAAEKKSRAVVGADDQILFNNRDGSTTTTVSKSDGSLQIVTTISGPGAPRDYRYDLRLSDGDSVKLRASGGIDIVDSGGAFRGGAAAPWARDSVGNAVPTRYEVHGSTIVQIIVHGSSSGVKYPVVADPWWGIDLYHSPYVSFDSKGYKINVTPTSWGTDIMNRGIETWRAHRDEVKTKLGGNA